MKRFTFLIVLATITVLSAIAQTPQAFMYQAVVRDNAGEILASTTVSLRMSVRHDSINGPVIYRETHLTTSNQFGLVNIEIGNGVADIGTFSSINWGDGSRYLETELDPEAGINYVSMGVSQLMSVPYALYSENTANKDDADADPSNELNTSVNLNGTTLEVGDAGGTLTTDLGSLIDDADADPNNEIQTISKVDYLVTLSERGGSFIDEIEDADADPANELNTSINLNGTTLGVGDAGGTLSTDLSSLVDDADADPGNELQTLSIAGSELSISDGNTVTISGSTAINKISDADGDTWIDTEQTADNDSISFVTDGNERARILPDGTLEVEGVVSANSFIGDGSGLTGVAGDNLGNHTAYLPLNMSHLPIWNVADPVEVSDAATKQYVDNNHDNLGNHTAQNYLNMSNFQITNLFDPTAANDAATKQYVDGIGGDNLGNHTATQNINLNGNWLSKSGGNEGIFVGNDGNVGIGTSYLTERFHVNGKARISSGVIVQQSSEDGVIVYNAGSTLISQPSPENNGIEVVGAEGHGLFVGGAVLDGVFIASAWNSGIHISDAGDDGVYVGSAADDGFIVESAGNPSTHTSSPEKNGFEVTGAEGNGLYVGRADLDGVSVNRALEDGVSVIQTGDDGFVVEIAGDDGFVVETAGIPTTQFSSYNHDGFVVEGAEGNGLFVGRADNKGVHVQESGGQGLYINEAGEEGIYIHGAGDDGLRVYQAGSRGVSVEEAANDGFYISSAGMPINKIPSNLKNGFEVAGAEGHGLFVGGADEDGVCVYKAGQNGIEIYQAGENAISVEFADEDGVNINTTGDDGFYIYSAGTPSVSVADLEGKNGFEVAGAEGHGLFVGRADVNGINIYQAGEDGVHVINAGTPSERKASSEKNGFEVEGAEGYGLYIGQSDLDGVKVYNSFWKGFSVNTVGNPSSHNTGVGKNGFEVEGAQGHGLYVGHADIHGVRVVSTSQNGVYVDSAFQKGVAVSIAVEDGFYVNQAGEDGFYVNQAGDDGVDVYNANNSGFSVGEAGEDGVYVHKAGACGLNVTDCEDGVYIDDATDDGVYVSSSNDFAFFGNTTDQNHEWGLFTPDKVHAYNIYSKGASTYAKNSGSSSLETGDIVCIAGGLEENVLDGGGFPVINIHKATQSNSQAVFGIVEYKVSIREESEEAPDGESQKVHKSFKHSDGYIEPGDYLSVVVFGQAEVKISDTKSIRAGQKLTVSEISGKARTLNNLDNWADTGILGKALEDSDGKGSIKVYVNCR